MMIREAVSEESSAIDFRYWIVFTAINSTPDVEFFLSFFFIAICKIGGPFSSFYPFPLVLFFSSMFFIESYSSPNYTLTSDNEVSDFK